MKKKILLTTLVVALAAAGLVTFILINANSLIRRYQPQLEQTAGRFLKSHVSFGALEMELLPSPAIQVSQFRIYKQPGSDGVSFNNLRLQIKLSQLLSGRIDIVKLEIVNPKLVLLKDQAGMRIEGLESPASPSKTPSDSLQREESAPGSPAPAPIDLNIEAVRVRNADLLVRDLQTNQEYTLSGLDIEAASSITSESVEISRIRADGELLGHTAIRLRGANLSYRPSSGSVNFDGIALTIAGSTIKLAGKYQDKNGAFTINSDALDLAALTPLMEKFSPAAAQYQPQGRLQPDLKINLINNAPAASGQVALTAVSAKVAGHSLSDASGSLSITADPQTQSVSSESLNFKLNGAPAQMKLGAALNNGRLSVRQLSVSAFSGSIEGTSEVSLASVMGFSTEMRASNLQLAPLLGALKPGTPPPLSGTLQSAQASLSGEIGPKLQQSLKGKTAIAVKDAKLEGMNLAAKVLKSITSIPFISGALYDSVPANERKALEGNETEIRSLTGSFTIANASLQTQDLTVLSPLFSLRAQGSIGFNANLNLNAQIAFNRGFSASMASKVKELRQMLNRQGEFEVPLAISGTPPEVVVIPDMSRLLKAAAEQLITEKATGLLDRALGGKGSGRSLLGF